MRRGRLMFRHATDFGPRRIPHVMRSGAARKMSHMRGYDFDRRHGEVVQREKGHIHRDGRSTEIPRRPPKWCNGESVTQCCFLDQLDRQSLTTCISQIIHRVAGHGRLSLPASLRGCNGLKRSAIRSAAPASRAASAPGVYGVGRLTGSGHGAPPYAAGLHRLRVLTQPGPPGPLQFRYSFLGHWDKTVTVDEPRP